MAMGARPFTPHSCHLLYSCETGPGVVLAGSRGVWRLGAAGPEHLLGEPVNLCFLVRVERPVSVLPGPFAAELSGASPEGLVKRGRDRDAAVEHADPDQTLGMRRRLMF